MTGSATRPLLSLLAALLLAPLLPSTSVRGEDGFVPLFADGTLDGWVNVNCAPETWSFDDDGLLVCTGKPIGELRTERMYQNFILELEWRHMVPRGNAGVFVWADDITARGQPFIRGVEIQVLENAYGNTKNYTTHGDIFPIHGATMTPTNGRGGSRSFPTENRSNPSPEWNHYRIECNDGTVRLAVNGKVVNEGRDCIPRKGYICLESEGGIVHYRHVRIKELPDTPVDPEHVAVEDRGYEALYNGVDFRGWTAGGGWVSKDWIISHEPGGDAPAILGTEREFGAIGFVFDVNFLPDSRTLRFFPRGPEGAAIEITPGTAVPGRRGKWVRVEGEIRGGKVRFRMNGEEQTEVDAGSPTSGPLAFETDAVLEMANVYVRALE